MAKVKMIQDPEFVDRPSRLSGDWFATKVEVTLKDGRVLSQQENTAYGHKGEAVFTKYKENTALAGLSESQINESISMVKDLENLKDITQLMDNLIV
jgi:hypothetical protein